jgi:xanthine dehydrogenase iron-sulfur cluster and FAD-binding subunit A
VNEMTNSHILVHEFDYREPATLDEAVALLNQYGRSARALAGGTDLLVQMKMERVKPAVVVSIRRIPGLDRIELAEDGLHIGSLATIRALRRHPVVRSLYPALAQACASFSTTQIQVMGTVGGNLCNASPASDSAPALIVYDAQAVVAGPDGERRLPVEDLFAGPGRTALAPGELLVELVLPLPAYRSMQQRDGLGAAFLKISRVAADIAKANAAVLLVCDDDRIVDCRMAFGSVAPRPFRARRAEAVLIGQVYSPELVAEAARTALQEITPIDDVRSNAFYRREIVGVMAHDGLEQAWKQARGAIVVQPDGREPGNGHGQGNGHEAAVEYAPSRETLLPEAQMAARSARPQGPAAAGGSRREIHLTVNGVPRRIWVAPNDLLLNVLREDLELTGTKYGCGIGECSACTVEMDGQPVLACLVLAASAAGSEIVTVEGLRKPSGELDPLQNAFLDHGAYQCGFCTPGMLMTARSLIRENPHPEEADVRDHLRGNLCRCTGYASIVRAVMSVGE